MLARPSLNRFYFVNRHRISLTFSLRSVSLTGLEMALEGAWAGAEVSAAMAVDCAEEILAAVVEI